MTESRYQYDPRLGQFRDRQSGRIVSTAQVRALVDREVNGLQDRLQAISRQAMNGRLTADQFQERFAQELKDHSLQMTMLGAGGKKRTTAAQYGALGRQLRDQYARIRDFTNAFTNGELTEKQILQRSRQYAEQARASFFNSEMRSREATGFNVAWRSLDPAAQHCPECLQYQTRKWMPISEVIAPGTKCSCAGRCRCTIRYWRNVSQPSLSNAIANQARSR